MAYYTSSYIFNNSTTSTAALMIWRAVSTAFEVKQEPVAGEELAAVAGMRVEELDAIFRQSYYQKYYGFKRFETIEEFRQWALSTGAFYNPDLHAPRYEEPADEEFDDEDEEDEEDETEE